MKKLSRILGVGCLLVVHLAVVCCLLATGAACAEETVPSYYFVGFAESTGMNGPDYPLFRFTHRGNSNSLVTSQLSWTRSPSYYLKNDEMPANAQTFNIERQSFLKIWQLVEAAKLRQRQQIETDRPPPDGGYCVFVVTWGAGEKKLSNMLVFRRDTETYKVVAPVVAALKQSMPTAKKQ